MGLIIVSTSICCACDICLVRLLVMSFRRFRSMCFVEESMVRLWLVVSLYICTIPSLVTVCDAVCMYSRYMASAYACWKYSDCRIVCHFDGRYCWYSLGCPAVVAVCRAVFIASQSCVRHLGPNRSNRNVNFTLSIRALNVVIGSGFSSGAYCSRHS